MVYKYIKESEDIEMDVQVGPKEEVEAEVGDKPEELTAIDLAKKEPETVVVAAVEKEKAEEAGGEGCEECEHEFYVDARDVEKYAELNEKTMLEALNDVIAANEADGMRADNLVVVMTESTMGYARNLEKNGAAMMFIKENEDESEEDDIEMDVQVGPDGEEKVAEDPQEANPVDAVKRDYGTVVVAKDGDEFFVDVEDVQKCADINCESVIKTLNGIIAANEASGIRADNLKVLITESTDIDLVNSLEECGVILEAKFSFMPKFKREPELQKYLGDLEDAENLLSAHNVDPKVGIHKAGRIALRVLSIYQNVGSILYLPICITIIGIPVYLLVRAWAWAYDSGEEAVAKAEGKKVLAKYDVLISEETDDKKKEKLQDARDKIAKGLEKLDK